MAETVTAPVVAPGASAGETTEVAAWRDATLLVLDSAIVHTVACGDSEVESFRKLARDSMDQLKRSPGTSQILITAGVLSQALSHYAQQTQKQVDGLIGEMGATLQIFLGHLDRLHADAEGQALIGELRGMLEAALQRGKLGEAREKAEEHMGALARHVEERRQQSLEMADRLQDRVTILEQSGGLRPQPAVPSQGAATDPGTSLPVRAEAEEAIRRAIDQQHQAFVVVFYIHRMQLTNARFGESIGNQVILFCSQHIATTINHAHGALFRWTGPAFVAVIERPESHLAVTSEMQRLMSTPLSRFFETPARSVYLPIKLTADVLPLFDTSFAEVMSGIERFILHASGQPASTD